jgi:hypothetical protein
MCGIRGQRSRLEYFPGEVCQGIQAEVLHAYLAKAMLVRENRCLILVLQNIRQAKFQPCRLPKNRHPGTGRDESPLNSTAVVARQSRKT